MSERRTRKMVNLAIEETSGVDHPAHLHEGWLVMKAADAAVLEAVESLEADADPEVDNPADAQEGHMEKQTEERLEDVLKEAPEAVRKAFEALEKQAEEALAKAVAAEESLRKEREERLDAAAVEKARASFAHLGLDPAEVGPALRRLAETDESLAKAVETALTAAEAKVESADIFAEIGRSTSPAGSALHKAEAMAKAAVADGSAATIEQALSDVFTSDPSLYTEYLAEKKG